MHTYSSTASSEAWRESRLLPALGQPGHQSTVGASSQVQKFNLLLPQSPCISRPRGWRWPSPPCLWKPGQRAQRGVVHAARRWPNPRPGLGRGWRGGQKGTEVGSLCRIHTGGLFCGHLLVKEVPALQQRGGLARRRFYK